MSIKVGLMIGSTRDNSFSERIGRYTASLFPIECNVEQIEISHLPYYNQDFDTDGDVPEEVRSFREKIKQYDAILFVTPEYNRSIPGVLKNALDIGSRPKVDNVWDGKIAGVISQSPGNIGGFGANHHLRQVLTALNMPIIQQPEMYLSNVMSFIDEDGNITNEDTIAFLQHFVDTFVQFIYKLK